MMTNIKKDLHKELSEQRKEVDRNWKNLSKILNENDTLTLKKICEKEQTYIKRKCRNHFKSRIEWMKKQIEKREDRTIPNEVDGILIKRQELEGRLQLKQGYMVR